MSLPNPPDAALRVFPDDRPTAVVDYTGKLLVANSSGRTAWGHLLARAPEFVDRLHEAPIERMLDSNLRVMALAPDHEDHIQLVWDFLTDAEIRLALFQAVSRAVNASLVLEDIFDALGSVLRTFIPFEAGTIVMLDDSQNRTKVTVHLDGEGQADIRGDNPIFTGYDPLLHAMLRLPRPQMLTQNEAASVLVAPDARQSLIAPLISKGVVIGCIGLSGEDYTDIQLELLAEVCEQLAVAVENARLYWQTQSQAGREFLINQITKAIRHSLDLTDILRTAADEVGRVLGLNRCVIQYWGTEASDAPPLFIEYVLPGTPTLSDPQAMSDFGGQLFLQRTDPHQRFNPFVLNDALSMPEAAHILSQEGIRSLAIFPILLDQAFVGTISLHQCDIARAWLNEEIELMDAITGHVAVALAQARLFAETEAQKRQLETTLAELQQMQMQLIQSEKMAVIGQFVAGIAHEVNTPLGTLLANDDTVKHCLTQLTVNEEQEKRFKIPALQLLDINRMAGDRIQEIVRNLRNFARLDESDVKRANLHEGLDSTLLLIQSAMKPGVNLVKDYGDIPAVDCFPGLLNQVFMNLLVNANHSMTPPGTITITTRADTETGMVTIAIRDTGKGIPPEHLSRIFDPGFTTKGVGVGTGLGLALCYRIMEKHYGRITVDSVVGEGTAMNVILPMTMSSIFAAPDTPQTF